MGFWNKLGKIAITAAPYVAAPFTGGASLLAVPAANKAVAKWSEHDANAAAAKGLAPSKFDKYLGMAGGIASMAGGAGAFGGMGDNFSQGKFTGAGDSGQSDSKFGKALDLGMMGLGAYNSIKNSKNGGAQQGPTSAQMRSGRTGIGPSSNQAIGSVMPRGGYRYNENPMNQLDQSNPNLAQSIFQGKQQAIRNQPFRSGYDITMPNPDSTDAAPLPPNVTRMPPIYGSSQRRRRNPAAESEVMY